jgi:hypothetical protein
VAAGQPDNSATTPCSGNNVCDGSGGCHAK